MKLPNIFPLLPHTELSREEVVMASELFINECIKQFPKGQQPALNEIANLSDDDYQSWLATLPKSSAQQIYERCLEKSGKRVPWPRRLVESGKILPNTILNLRFNKKKRGVTMPKQKYFRNSITMDIATGTKNVSIKLSENRVQMCGATSKQMAQEVVIMLFGHISELHSELDHYPRVVPRLATCSQEEYEAMNELYAGELTYELRTAMVNMNFEVKNRVNRLQLAIELQAWECLETRNNPWIDDPEIDDENHIFPFKVRYDANMDNNVNTKIMLADTDEIRSRISRKEDKELCVTFLIYATGRVTFSSPDTESMPVCYNLFMTAINDIAERRPDIFL